MKKAVIVLPTYNERENIRDLIPEIFKVVERANDWDIHVLVVDDSSPDNTAAEVGMLKKRFRKLHLIQGKKEGLGKAYSRGFSYVLENLRADVLFEMDADWSHDPNVIPVMLEKIDEGADIVIGTRYIKGGGIPKDWGLHRKIFSFCGNLIVRLGFMHLSIHDWTNGYRVIKTPFLKTIMGHLRKYNGYVFQIALLDKVVKRHLTVAEVPVKFKERASGKSKINPLKYIYDILMYIFINSSFVKFAFVGFVGFVINVACLEVFYRFGFTPAVAAAFGAEISIISNFLLNNFWSFSHKKIENKWQYIPKFMHFNFVSAGSIIIQFVVVGVGTYLFGDSTRFLFLVLSVILFIMPYSYFMYNRFIWKHK